MQSKEFTKAFSDFIKCLACKDEPVVFVLDDFHWCDSASLELIDSFFSHNNSERFLFLISYDNAELNKNSKLRSFIEKFAKLRRRFLNIELKPFDKSMSAELAEDLCAELRPSSVLISELHNRSEGKPLKFTELLKTFFLEEMYVTVDSLVYDIEALEASDLRILQTASIIGPEFSAEELNFCLGEVSSELNAEKRNDQIEAVLNNATAQKLLIKETGESKKYKFFSF